MNIYYKSDAVKLKKMKARGVRMLFEVVPNGNLWEVRRIILDERREDGAYSRLFSSHESEQEAEAKVLEIYGEGSKS